MKDAVTPQNHTETALVRTLLDAVRRLEAAGVDPLRATYRVRVSPRGGDETAWVEVPVGHLPMVE